MHLLVVDDLAVNRKLLRVMLESEGHSILEAADGVEALNILASETVDAVVSDILMPNMDGFRLCQEIRGSRRLRALPLILFTSTYTSLDDMRLARDVGADRCLTKPAPAAAVLDALREILDPNFSRQDPTAPVIEEMYVLRQYSQALVRKLEDKNTGLHEALGELRCAHALIVEMNSVLEERVRQRTEELETANRSLSVALSEVRELGKLLPICGYCKKIRDDKDYWQSVDGYITERTNTKFSHGVCPDCFEKIMIPELERNGIAYVRKPARGKEEV